jgi:hypothetical protein
MLRWSHDQAVVDDIGWARHRRPSQGLRAAIGWHQPAIGAFTKHPDQALTWSNA